MSKTFDLNSKFNIMSNFTLSTDDLSTLSLLYAPLMGSDAYMLYMAFQAFLERNNLKSETFTHKDFLSIYSYKENDFLRAKPNGVLFSKGFETNESGYGKYWLKSFDSRHDYAKIVDSFGNITRAKINNPNIGVRPAMWLKKERYHRLIEE